MGVEFTTASLPEGAATEVYAERMIRRPGIVSRFRVVGNRAELNYRGTTSVQMLYPPLALVERRNLDGGVSAVLLETSGGLRALLIGEETIAEVAALPKSSIDPRTGALPLDALIRNHFEGSTLDAGAPVPAPESRPATLLTDGSTVTLTVAGERQHFLLNSADLPAVVGSETVDEYGEMLVSVRLPNRTVIPLRIPAEALVDAEKALVALRAAAASRQANSPPPAVKRPPVAMVPREHSEANSVLVLGILSLVCCGILGPFAWSQGNKVIAEMDQSPGAIWTNRGSVVAGRVCGIISSAMLALGVVWFVLVGLLAVGR